MNINYDYYKVFYSVASHLSFSLASQELFLSQSAVSQSIKQLESKLDTQLFNRSTKQVALTKEGEKLFEHIEPAIHLIQSAETYLQETKTLQRGQLHIGASDTICKYYLLNYFKQFHQLFPGIEIKVTNRTSYQCVELLKQGKVDLIISNLPNLSIDDDDMTVIPTLAFQDVFISKKDHSLGNGPYTLERLSSEPLLMLTKQTTTSVYVTQLFEMEGLSITPSVELGSIDLLVDLASIGLGIAFVPDFTLTNHPDLEILSTSPLIPKRQLGIILQKKRPMTEAAKKFIDLLLVTTDLESPYTI